MSIIDSPADLERAKATLAESTPDQLSEDLRFWSVAVIDAAEEYDVLTHQRAAVGQRYSEATEWAVLISREMRKRRDGTDPSTKR